MIFEPRTVANYLLSADSVLHLMRTVLTDWYVILTSRHSPSALLLATLKISIDLRLKQYQTVRRGNRVRSQNVSIAPANMRILFSPHSTKSGRRIVATRSTKSTCTSMADVFIKNYPWQPVFHSMSCLSGSRKQE